MHAYVMCPASRVSARQQDKAESMRFGATPVAGHACARGVRVYVCRASDECRSLAQCMRPCDHAGDGAPYLCACSTCHSVSLYTVLISSAPAPAR
jgi:hypothetical protein